MVSTNTQFRKDVSVVSPMDVLADAFNRFEQSQISISFSGAEDVVLIEMAYQLLGNRVPVFCLDTGRLHPETYRYIDQVRKHYGISINMLSPDPANLEQLVREKGLFSFYQDGHHECCAIRKIQPLTKKLCHLDAWITGQRRDQNVTRTELPQEQEDRAFSTRVSVVDLTRCLALHPNKRRSLQSTARSRVFVNRLRTVYALHLKVSARTGRALVVGRRERQRVRPARTKY